MADDTDIGGHERGPAPVSNDYALPTQVHNEMSLERGNEEHRENDTDTGDEINATVLDPDGSERQIYVDPFTNVQREIWRPGDGDGDRLTDYFDRPGPPPPFEHRWRFYQVPTGTGLIQRGVNEPPKYVILDDRAAYEVLTSDMYRSNLVRYWPHDFGGQGKIRHRRPHRGRGAIGDSEAVGIDKYHFVILGQKYEKYYFTGQADYKPVMYHISTSKEANVMDESADRLVTPPPGGISEDKGHTYDQRAPNGKLMGKGGGRGRPLSNILGHEHTVGKRLNSISQQGRVVERGMWFAPHDSVPRKRHKRASERQHMDLAGSDEDAEASPDMEASALQQKSSKATDNVSAGPDQSALHVRPRQQGQRQDFFSRLLTQQRVLTCRTCNAGDPSVQSSTNPILDSGSYAATLEVELGVARKTIQEQAGRIAELQEAKNEAEQKIGSLEAEIEMFKKEEVEKHSEPSGKEGGDARNPMGGMESSPWYR